VENDNLPTAILPNVSLQTTVCLIVDLPTAILPNGGGNMPRRVKKGEPCMFGGLGKMAGGKLTL